MKKLLILGAGGFGQMVKETALAMGYEEIKFLDDAVKSEEIVGMCCDYVLKHAEFPAAVAAFGNNKTRLFWTDKLIAEGYQLPVMLHPSAIISPSAQLAPGCFVMQRAMINTNSKIEQAALINCGAIVDHDSVVCTGAYIGLNSVVKAHCTIASAQKVEAGEQCQ